MTLSYEHAEHIARVAHAGQVDKSGADYIEHPLRVAAAVASSCKVVAVLHDVLEDTALDATALLRRLSPDEARALVLVSRPPACEHAGLPRPTYREFVEAIAVEPGEAGRVARAVKRADIHDNLGRLTPELSGLRRRYAMALVLLG